jgi:outer membrane biosynthesis protein TonB
MKPTGRLDSGRRKRAWPPMLNGLAISLIAGIAWAIPGLNDACEQVRRPTTPIAQQLTVERPKPEAPNVEPPRLELPRLELPRPELPTPKSPSVELPSAEPPSVEPPSVEPPSVGPLKIAEAPCKSTAVAKAAQRGTRAQEHAIQAKGHGSAAARDELASLGFLDKSTVQRHIRLSEAKMRYCYERSMAKHTRTGTVRVQFVITPGGTVTSLTSTAIGVDTEVSSCVAAIVKDIEFPRSGAPVQVVYPFRFVLSDD